MISSMLYFICFAILLYNTGKAMRAVCCFGMAHILIENLMLHWFSVHPEFFDLSFYMMLCWMLDIALLFCSACVLSGWKKKLTLSIAVPVLFCQIIAMQFPFVIPQILDFAINSSYQTVMESIILCGSLKDGSIKDWIKTSLIVSLVVIARFIPAFIN